MSKRYTDGARAFIYSILGAILLTVGAVVVLIVSLIDPSPRKMEFNAAEFIPTKNDSDDGCRFDWPSEIVPVEKMAEWLNASDRRIICMKKKSDGFWVIFDFEPPKDNPA